MLLHCLFALCLSLLAVSPSHAGYFQSSYDSGITYLPIDGDLPALRVYELDMEPYSSNQYIFFITLEANETYRIDTPLCNGCVVQYAGCSGGNEYPDCWWDLNKNYFLLQTAPGLYFFVIYLPVGQSLYWNVIHEKHINDQVIPSLLFYRIHNPDPNPPSSTGPAVEWPLGRLTGLFIADGVSSAYLPHTQDGWPWMEYDRDLSNYSFNVGFVTHLMTMDAFWIDPTFGHATYVSTSLNHTVTPGTWFGTWDNPITDEFTNFDYHFSIPFGEVIEITLHYIYQLPGESVINNQTVTVEIGNFFGLDPNDAVSQARSVNKQGSEISLPESESSALASDISVLSVLDTDILVNKKPILVDEKPSAANDAPAAALSVWPVIMCALAAMVSLC